MFHWDLYTAFTTALLGALGVGLGGLTAEFYQRRASRPRRHFFILIIAGFVGVALTAGRFGLTSKIKYFLFPQSMMEDVTRSFSETVLKNPRFVKATEGMDVSQIQEYIAGLTKRGLHSLSFDDLKTWNSLQLELSKLDISYCASLWKGQNAAVSVVAFHKLPPEDYQKLMELSDRAVQLALEEKQEAPVDRTEIQKGLEEIANNLPDNEVQRFRRAVLAGPQIPAEDACFLILRVMKGVGHFAPAEEEAFLRALTGI